jgi:hypothetical protein
LKTLFLLLISLVFASNSFAFAEWVKETKNGLSQSDSLVRQIIEIERESILKNADEYLRIKPRTITASPCERSMGGKHDFYSEGPYWWPDPANPTGPYIRKDGIRNPDRYMDHDRDLVKFSKIVGTQTSAFLLTGKEKYAQSAMLNLKAWFVDSATRMNPNMLYAQAIKGICTGRGVGIIDAVPLMDVAQSVMILEKSNSFPSQDIDPIKEWFKQFLSWLTTHPYGIDEMNAKNNHGMWWHAQAAVYARLVGDEQVLQLCLDHYKNTLLPNQMAADGSFPLELERTNPYSYSLFNLDAMTSLAWTLSDKTSDVWNYSLPDGRGLSKGLNFMMPYIQDKTKWPYKKDVSNWNNLPTARQFMLFAALAGNDPKWFDLWKSIIEKSKGDKKRLSNMARSPLLWIGLAPRQKDSGKQNK